MATNPAYFMQQQFTDAGAVAANYLLDTFLSGTTTPATTWQDAAEGATNASPIVLDAGGRCTIFLNPAVLYTFRLRTPGGTTVWTRDSIAGQPVTDATQFLPLDGSDDMTGLFALSGNATAALHPVPLQQAQTLISAASASLTTALSGQIMVGAVMMWMLPTAPNDDWLLLNGVAASRSAYPALFALWGTTFGAGDGSTTFGIPGFSGYVPRGLDLTGLIDPDGGTRVLGSIQQDLVKAHTHSYVATANGRSGGAEGGARDSAGHGENYTTGANVGAENRMKNIAVNFIVKAA
jgi:microcystin-dependent protein